MTEPVDEYTIYVDPKNLIGSGSFGQVFKGKHNDNGLGVAVKKVPLQPHPLFMRYIEREANALQAVSHANIVQLYDIKRYPNVVYFIMELCDSNLDTYFRNNPDLSQDTIVDFMLGTTRAVQHMHHLDPPLIHRDIKPGNVLIKATKRTPVIKLADFGLTRATTKDATHITATECGTDAYMAPEMFPDVLNKIHYNTLVDVFSTGILFLAMIEANPGNSLISYRVDEVPLGKAMCAALKKGKTMEPPVNIHPTDTVIGRKVKDIIKKMIVQNPSHRCNIDTVVKTLEHIKATSGHTEVHEGMATLHVSSETGGDDAMHGAVGGERATTSSMSTPGQSFRTAHGSSYVADWPSPLCLIETGDTGTDFHVNPETVSALEKVPAPLVVVAVVGLYGTGKSYLMNLLANETKGFNLGSTSQSKTKGIWIWCVAHPTKAHHTLVLLDTEGFGDVSKGDRNQDVRLFSFVVLLSSMLVYNSKGTIDNDAFEKLHFLPEIAEHIRVKSDDGETDEDFHRFFPDFEWVVRDFTLDMEENGHKITATEYLESALLLKKGVSKKVKEHNSLRENILEYFLQRHCFTFPMPVNDDDLTHRLDELTKSQLNPNFRQAVDEFAKHIHQNAPTKLTFPKSLPDSGSILAGLTQAYVEASQSGAPTCMESALEQTAMVENSKAVEAAVQMYDQKMNEAFSHSTKMDVDKLSYHHEQCYKEAITLFLHMAIFDEDNSYHTTVKEKLTIAYKHWCDLMDKKAKSKQTDKKEKITKVVPVKTSEPMTPGEREFTSASAEAQPQPTPGPREFTAAPGSRLNVSEVTSFRLIQETHTALAIAENDIIVQDKDNAYRYKFIKNEFKLMWTKPKPTQINGYCYIVISNDSAILMQNPDYSSPTYAYDADLQFVQKHQHDGWMWSSLPDGALVYKLTKADDECSLMVHTAAREDIHLSPPAGITWGQRIGVCASTDGGYVVTERASQFLGIYDKAGNLVTKQKLHYKPHGYNNVTRCGASHLFITDNRRTPLLHIHSAISGEHLHTLTAQQLGVQEEVFAVTCSREGQLMVVTAKKGPNTTGQENWMLTLHAYQLDAR